MSNVIHLFAAKPEPETTVSCGCCEHRTCYSHRVAAVAEDMRHGLEVLPDEAGRTTNWLVLRSEVERLVGDALAELDAITAETLPNHPPTEATR